MVVLLLNICDFILNQFTMDLVKGSQAHQLETVQKFVLKLCLAIDNVMNEKHKLLST